ncbi:hypothetical protein D3C72_2557100 [compost metagenome]
MPLALGWRYISDTLSPRSAIRVGGSVAKKVTISSLPGASSQTKAKGPVCGSRR